MAQPLISAAQAVAELLILPEDLGKITNIRTKLEKEKASIDVKLRSGVKDQLDSTKDALSKLHKSKDGVRGIQDELILIDAMCKDPSIVVRSFDRTSRISAVHRNFSRTEEMVKQLLEMYDKLDILEKWIRTERNDIPGPAPNLLRTHYQITQLEVFRNNTMYQAKQASEKSRATLEQWFERLNNLIIEFEEYLWLLAENILTLVRAGYPEVVIMLLKIVEFEGREDEKSIALKIVKRTAKLEAAAKFKAMAANSRELKLYRSKLVKKVADSIQSTLDANYDKNKQEPSVFLNDLNWMYQDIVRITDDVILLFPADYDISTFYIKTYHKSLNTTLQRLVNDEPDASTILTLNAWLKEYKKTMKELEIPPDLLDPPLLDGKENELIKDYLKLIVNKMDEWTNNLMKTEVAEFTNREQPPEQDADGMYGMQGAVILFKMINQQADAAADSGQGAVLKDVVKEFNRVMKSTQEQWSKLIDAEYKKQIEKPEETPGGLVEYVTALANDQIKCADYTEKLSERLEPLVSEKYKNEIADSLNDALEGYLDVATRRCVTTLVDLIYNDLKPATKQLFTNTWYSGIMPQIVETIRDYMLDYREHLNALILDVLIEELIDSFIVIYLTALGNCGKLRMPETIDRIKDDVREAFKFFCTLKPAKDLEKQFEVVDLVLGLLEASKTMAFLSFWDFAKIHGPNIPFVEAVMRARDDLDRSGANEVMEAVKRKVKDENLTDPPEPTIMKKVQIQTTFQKLFNTATNVATRT